MGSCNCNIEPEESLEKQIAWKRRTGEIAFDANKISEDS